VDFLFVDGKELTVWMPWLAKARCKNRPQAFVWMGPWNTLEDKAQGPVAKNVRKDLERLGYKLQYQLCSAEKIDWC
jgi:hypothetical protein